MSDQRDWLHFRRLAASSLHGEMAERTKATVSKTVESLMGFRGFESHSLRGEKPSYSLGSLAPLLFHPPSGRAGRPLGRTGRAERPSNWRDGRADEGDGLENR